MGRGTGAFFADAAESKEWSNETKEEKCQHWSSRENGRLVVCLRRPPGGSKGESKREDEDGRGLGELVELLGQPALVCDGDLLGLRGSQFTRPLHQTVGTGGTDHGAGRGDACVGRAGWTRARAKGERLSEFEFELVCAAHLLRPAAPFVPFYGHLSLPQPVSGWPFHARCSPGSRSSASSA